MDLSVALNSSVAEGNTRSASFSRKTNDAVRLRISTKPMSQECMSSLRCLFLDFLVATFSPSLMPVTGGRVSLSHSLTHSLVCLSLPLSLSDGCATSFQAMCRHSCHNRVEGCSQSADMQKSRCERAPTRERFRPSHCSQRRWEAQPSASLFDGVHNARFLRYGRHDTTQCAANKNYGATSVLRGTQTCHELIADCGVLWGYSQSTKNLAEQNSKSVLGILTIVSWREGVSLELHSQIFGHSLSKPFLV